MKVSVIMQSYLGAYPGSRVDADKKFIRAINSFLNQTYKNSELIIVSDGCSITHDLYYANFKKEERVKYVYVDKDTPNMYEGAEKYYRGLPRQVGRSIATGGITTYMDSDDFLLPKHIEYIVQYWKANKSIHMLINQSWVDHKNGIFLADKLFKKGVSNVNSDTVNFFKIDQFGDNLWFNHDLSTIILTPWVIAHDSGCSVKWEDVQGIGKSEDNLFIERIIKKHRDECLTFKAPTYVRCHLANKWDC